MPDYKIADIRAALLERRFPTITSWNRLEGRPRRVDFERSLEAEVRDALWMLSRQWQMGEFKGDDAGSPVAVKLHGETTRLRKVQLGTASAEALDDSLPLEARVEQRALPFVIGDVPVALDLRLAMGRQWLRLIGGIGPYAAAFVDRYKIDVPDETSAADAATCAHLEAWQLTAAVAGRCMDGAALYIYLTGGAGRHPWDQLATAVSPAHEPALDAAAVRFIAWFRRLFQQPSGGDAWDASRLEYRFACSAPAGSTEKVVRADGYHHGHLDWYSIDVDPALSSLGPAAGVDVSSAVGTIDVATLPTPLTWSGMPNTRWWAFEDRKINFGDIRPDTTDIAKLLLIEFGLVYANDWFLLPVPVQVGSLTTISGIVVTSSFGEKVWIRRAGEGADDDWQRWSMYRMSVAGTSGQPSDGTLAYLAVTPHGLEGDPIEDVFLRRDEVANMAWGVEKKITLRTGTAKSGDEAAVEYRAHLQRLLDASLPGPRPRPDPTAPSRYDVMTTTPENWIPFVPVHVPNSTREIQLQRASMPRVLEGASDRPKIKPRTTILRAGLDQTPAKPWFVHEEEVPRCGVRVTKAFQRVRWSDGRVIIWLGLRKGLGSGETHSGLAFDRLVTS